MPKVMNIFIVEQNIYPNYIITNIIINKVADDYT